MRNRLGILAAFGVVLFLAGVGLAQPWKGRMAGWGPGDPYNRMYNPATVETLKGTVEKVDRFTPGRGMSYGVHILLKTDKETIPVHLGPGWYVEAQEVKMNPGDKVEVTGSRITFEGKPAIVASQVKKGGQTLTLRDASGTPAWAGKGRRGR